MDYLIGFFLAVGACGGARLAGFDRERVFYPTLLIVVATYYVLFAIMGDIQALVLESVMATAFVAAAVAGFRVNLWIVVVALAGHGLFDVMHPWLFPHEGVPVWWPGFCLVFDIGAAAFLGLLLVERSDLAVDKGAGKQRPLP